LSRRITQRAHDNNIRHVMSLFAGAPED